jgi:hypothetical protein
MGVVGTRYLVTLGPKFDDLRKKASGGEDRDKERDEVKVTTEHKNSLRSVPRWPPLLHNLLMPCPRNWRQKPDRKVTQLILNSFRAPEPSPQHPRYSHAAW